MCTECVLPSAWSTLIQQEEEGAGFFLKHATSTLVMVTQEFCSIVTSKQQVKQKLDLIILISGNVFCNMTVTDTNCIYNITLYDLKLQ